MSKKTYGSLEEIPVRLNKDSVTLLSGHRSNSGDFNAVISLPDGSSKETSFFQLSMPNSPTANQASNLLFGIPLKKVQKIYKRQKRKRIK